MKRQSSKSAASSLSLWAMALAPGGIFLEIRPCYIAKVSLKLTILLTQAPHSLDYRHGSNAYEVSGTDRVTKNLTFSN